MPVNMVELPIAVVVHAEQDMVEVVVGKVSALIAELNPPKICLCFWNNVNKNKKGVW